MGGLNHGHSKRGNHTSEYMCWQNMLRRCYTKTNPEYKRYGARGIIVCDEWKNSFEAFLNDVGEKPSKEYSLDRIDVNGNYCKENCRWATILEQSNNTRRNVYITYQNETLTIPQWARKFNLDKNTLKTRLREGWSIDKLFEPIKKKTSKEDIVHIIKLRNEGLTLNEISIKFNLSIAAISKILIKNKICKQSTH